MQTKQIEDIEIGTLFVNYAPEEDQGEVHVKVEPPEDAHDRSMPYSREIKSEKASFRDGVHFSWTPDTMVIPIGEANDALMEKMSED